MDSVLATLPKPTPLRVCIPIERRNTTFHVMCDCGSWFIVKDACAEKFLVHCQRCHTRKLLCVDYYEEGLRFSLDGDDDECMQFHLEMESVEQERKKRERILKAKEEAQEILRKAHDEAYAIMRAACKLKKPPSNNNFMTMDEEKTGK